MGGLVAALAAAGVPAAADERVRDGVDDTITVVATLTERSLDEVAATVSVISADEMERQVMRDIRDIVRYEPGVSVAGTGSRFGLGGFNIRGIGGNRVLTIVDGVRVAEEFSFGPFLSSRRDFVDIDSLQRVEIARGPISTLYGSDALGGVVAFTTRKPGSYVDADRPIYAGARAGLSSEDDSLSGTTTLGLGNDSMAGLLTLTRREGDEVENMGSVGGTGPGREQPNPQEFDTTNIDFKLSFQPAEGHELLLTLDHFENDTFSNLLSDVGVGGTLSRLADDTRERRRYAVDYTYTGDLVLAERVNLLAYRQTSESFQRMEEVIDDGMRFNRFRESSFEQEIEGIKAVLHKSLVTGGLVHRLSYGAEYYTTESADLRDGALIDTATGAELPQSGLPTRDFPPTEVDQAAVFLQNEMEFLDGRLLVMPGLRYDDFEATVDADGVFFAGNPGAPQPADYGDSELSLKLGTVYQFGNGVSVFARYSEGFRAPPFDDVNVGFSNFLRGYKTISNPDLESETSEGVEAGLRIAGDVGSLRLAVFRNDYDNFIESFAIAPQFAGTFGIDPVDGLLTFQSVNRDQVEIDGAELSGSLRFGHFASAMEGLYLRGSVAYAEGEDAAGEPVDSVEPLTGVIGLGYEAPGGRWGAEMIWTLVDGKNADDISGDRPATSGYATVDLLAHLDVTERVTVNVGLFNLADREYIRWADTAAIGTDAPARFTQPGFHGGATVRVSL
jgi:hemoglobin/transferrin/lactoferrin receptor protein